MRILSWVPILCALCFGASPSMPQGGADYTTIPPDPASVTRGLEGLEIKLSRAIEIAQKEVDGFADSARTVRVGDQVSFEVDVFSLKCLSRISVDARTGKVTNRLDTPRFPGEPVSGDWTQLPSGLKYYELKPGNGPAPSSPKDAVSIEYTAWLVDGTKVDSTLDKGAPLVIGPNKLVKGLEEGVMGMKVGGKRKLILPYDLAYGLGGKPPMIPPKATLIIDIVLESLP
ncbi:MAG: FKBP-type peptidyl-prolyl cis-trans isomerase [Planctomycetes bacterium]|nr:FKBP-type peptidyl-prolyl cis-trans isomerase [Planctomycetota bacterium]